MLNQPQPNAHQRISRLVLLLTLGAFNSLGLAQDMSGAATLGGSSSISSGLSGSSSSIGQAQFLPVNKAFAYFTAKPAPDQLTVHWDIAPGYYLYLDKFAFSINGQPISASMPSSRQHSDEFFGDVEVFYQQVTATLTLPKDLQTGRVSLDVEFQGCAEAGLCYPPQRDTIALDL